MEVQRFCDIQSSPAIEERSSVCQLCQKEHHLGTETKPLLADVELKFERAEMQMIRWMSGVSMKG